MKKLISVVVILGIIFLCSCSGQQKMTFVPQREFVADIEYMSDAFSFSAHADCQGYSCITFSVTSPESLKGMTVKVNETGITAALSGNEYTFDDKALGDKPGIGFAVQTIRRFIYTDCEYFKTAEGFCAQAEFNWGTANICCAEDGYPKYIASETEKIIFLPV